MAKMANQTSSLEHPGMGVVMALSGLVGIAIPLMDHHYILLGYLLCWGAGLAICIIYYPQWRLAAINHFGTMRYKKKTNGNDYLFAPIFVVIYIIAPIVISFSTPKSQDYITDYGSHPPGFTYMLHDQKSFVGARVGYIKADGSLLKDNIGSGYKLFGISFHHANHVDPKDEPDVSRSGPYDVVDQEIDIEIPWSERFFSELIPGMHGTTYALVAVPNGNASRDFNTVRDVINLGGQLLEMRGGPP
jgi:hypothetical protein